MKEWAVPKIVDGDERREFIARIAAEVIATEGIERATIREIARQAGATRGLVEHHFRSKAEVIEKALDWLNRRYLLREQRVLQGKQGLAALEARIRCFLPISPAARREWRLRLRFWSSNDPQVQAVQRKRLAETRRLFCDDIVSAVALGQMPSPADPLLSAERLLSRVAGLSAQAVVDRHHYTSDHLLAELSCMMDELRQGRPM